MAKMTMTEFAKEIGVHYATVSRVYNNQPGVADAKREFILERAEALGFYPNTAARGLKMQKSFAVGMVIPHFLFSYWGRLLLEVQSSLEAENYGVLVSPASVEEGDTLRAVRFLIRQGVDAIILSSDNHTMLGKDKEILEIAKASKIPILLLVTKWESSPFPFVGNDVPADMELACNHLLELGHTRIAVMASDEFNPGSSRRLEGCRQAMTAAGFGNDNLQVLHGGYGYDDGEKAARQWIELPDRPTAIIASTDPATIGIYKAFRDEGIRIPEDVSVMGYGDGPDINLLTPGLTTIAHPFQELAKAASDHILRCMKSQTIEADEEFIPGHLVIRESCQSIRTNSTH